MEAFNTQLHDYLQNLEKKERVQKRSLFFGLIFGLAIFAALGFSAITSGFSGNGPEGSAPATLSASSGIVSSPPPTQQQSPEPVVAVDSSAIAATDTVTPDVAEAEIAQAPVPEAPVDLANDFGFRIVGDPKVGSPLTFRIVNFQDEVEFVLYYGDGSRDEQAKRLNEHTYAEPGTYAVRLKAKGPRTPENLYASYVLTITDGSSSDDSPFAHQDGLGLDQ